MKWLFRAIFLILAVFLIIMAVGATRPDSLTVEREVSIASAPEDVFYYINDLSVHPDWSPWISLDDEEVVGGPSSGQGQTLGWKSLDGTLNQQTIIESLEGAFVRTELSQGGHNSLVTYALTEDDKGDTDVMMSKEMQLGGFPYVQRIFTARFKRDTTKSLTEGLSALKVLVENEAEFDEPTP
ncbi:MAG: SRPBCC family protein [Robiginitomaculum sp.]